MKLGADAICLNSCSSDNFFVAGKVVLDCRGCAQKDACIFGVN